jgi:ATP adenylyltransferase
MSYIRRGRGEPRRSRGGSAGVGRLKRPFTDIPNLSDEDGLVVARGELVYAVLNLYPYNPGHLMVVPYRQVSELEDLTAAETAELMAFTQKAIRVMKGVSSPDGFNVGLNLGRSAGGSLAEHLHMHVVPRWSGDANFITVIGETKVIPQLLQRHPRTAGHGVGQSAVSNFYLLTRAAYASCRRRWPGWRCAPG